MVSKAQKSTAVIIATYNGHLHVGQLRAARALEEAGVPLVWVALRNPYDLARLAPGTIGVAAYAYSQPVLDALVRLLNGEITCPTGRLPVTLPKE
jgi:beta-N-acetylhexosaminidase